MSALQVRMLWSDEAQGYVSVRPPRPHVGMPLDDLCWWLERRWAATQDEVSAAEVARAQAAFPEMRLTPNELCGGR